MSEENDMNIKDLAGLEYSLEALYGDPETLAKVKKKQFDALVEVGFTEDQAMELLKE